MSYDSIVLGDSKVTFLGEGDGGAFHLFLYYVFFIDSIA